LIKADKLDAYVRRRETGPGRPVVQPGEAVEQGCAAGRLHDFSDHSAATDILAGRARDGGDAALGARPVKGQTLFVIARKTSTGRGDGVKDHRPSKYSF